MPELIQMEWGPSGALAASRPGGIAVIVDVLSFTTTLTVAIDAGAEVFPYPFTDDSAQNFARRHDATLAVGRFEARLRHARRSGQPLARQHAHDAPACPDRAPVTERLGHLPAAHRSRLRSNRRMHCATGWRSLAGLRGHWKGTRASRSRSSRRASGGPTTPCAPPWRISGVRARSSPRWQILA